MPKKGLLLALVLSLLSACDSSTPEQAAAPAPASQQAAPVQDLAALGKRYAGRPLEVVDVSEVQLEGASALAVTFGVPLDPEQDFAAQLHLVDSKDGNFVSL